MPSLCLRLVQLYFCHIILNSLLSKFTKLEVWDYFTMQRVPFCGTCCKPYALQGSGKPVGQRIPKLLDCSHTLCQGCVTKIAGNQAHVLNCPTCKEQTVLSGGKKNIKNLPTNLYILGILINNVRANIENDITKAELLDFEFEKGFTNAGGRNEPRDGGVAPEVAQAEENAKVCDECSENAAISQCQKCEATFCESCFDSVHMSSRTLRSHKAIPLALTHLFGVTTQTCETHEGRELEFYDHNDGKLICSLCIVTPAYQGHKIVPAHELTDEITDKIKQSLQNVKKVHAQLQKSKGKLSLLFPEIKTEFSDVVQHIREHFQDLHTKLQAREVNLIKAVKDAYCSKTFPAELTEEVNRRSEEIGTLINQVNTALFAPSIIMKVGETLLSKMADFEDIPCVLPESFLHDLVKISYSKEFQDALNSYGTIVSESSSLKLNKISEQPDDFDENEEPSAVVSTKPGDHPKANTAQTRSGPTILTMPSRQNLVTVSHISTPTDFFIQHVADSERLENLMDAIQTRCEGAKSMNDAVKTTQIGDLVCAKGESDDWWYRARIISEQQQTSVPKGRNQPLPKVKVYFIDYGNTEVAPLNRLRKIPPKFADLPELATNCSLVDIVPPGQCKTWPNGSIKALGSMVRDKHLLMAVIRKRGGKLLVDLKSPDTDRSTASDKPASVRDALVFLEVAHFTSPASVPNPDVAFPVHTFPNVTLLKEGETLQVTVTYTETPDAMYVQKYNGAEYDDMLKILQQMLNVYTSKSGDQWQIGWPYKDMVCAGRYSEDQNWYRALVKDVSADKSAKVLFVDFGNSEELPFSEIRRLPDHLSKLPKQAMKCRLAGIKPADQGEGWSNECGSFLNDNCFLHPYRMKVVETEGDKEPMSVVLYLPTPQEASSLNHQLVLSSHAALSTDAECLETGSVEPSSPASNASTRASEADDSTSSINNEQGKLLFPQRLSYMPVDMPESNQFQFLVTYVDKDCTISGFQPDKRDHSLADLMRHMQKICKGKDGPSVTQDQLSFNQPCCAKYSTDNEWYRAQIVSFPTSSTVLVDYVDFGNREEIPLRSISLNAAFLDIPKQCIASKLEGLPQTPVEQEKVSKLLEGLLVGEICEAVASTKFTIDGVINIEHLTLPDGRDAVDAARDMMMRQRKKLEEKPCASQPLKQSPAVETPQDEKRMSEKMKSRPAKSILADTVLPAEGIPFDVAVTQINSKSVVFLQREIPSEDSPRLAVGHDPTHIIACDHLHQMLDMSNKINLENYFNGKPNVSKVWSNMLCCGRYTEDDLWYRAQVIEVVANDPLQASVLYVDYGTSEVIGLERMKAFAAELASLPKQAFQCTVIGLSEENGDSDDDIDSLANVVTDKKLICKVVSFGPPILVELYERVVNEESYEDVPIGQRVSELDVMADEFENDADEDTTSSEELSEKEETVAAKEENEQVDGETDDFTSDVNPVGDWYSSECEDTFMTYDREGLSTRPQLLTPAQFLLKKENVVEHEKTVEVQEESEVD